MNVIEPELLPKIRSLLEAYTDELEGLNGRTPPTGGAALLPSYHSQAPATEKASR